MISNVQNVHRKDTVSKRVVNVKYLILFTLMVGNVVDQTAPQITIEQGVLSGRVSDDGLVLEYVGIPYAIANVTNRFQAPLPPPSWTGVFKAIDYNSRCPQRSLIGGRFVGSEDCLKINVYVPAIADRKVLPVMFFIHGGAFILGSGGPLIYGPNFLVKHDVILVTFNYRLDALGFLCLGIKEAPGNAGMKDQLAALKWVKKNIAAFGGDPDNITIFGESAGGTSVSTFLASESTEGLFNRAIVMSGSSISTWGINRYPISTASILAKAHGYNTTDPYELYKIFSEMSLEKLIGTDVKRVNNEFFDSNLLYYPCIEEKISGVEPFLTDLPYNLLRNKPKNISLMFGSNSREGLFLIAEDTEERLEKRNYYYAIPSDLQFNNKKEAEDASNNVKKFYFGDERISKKISMKISEYYTHLFFEIPIIFETNIFRDFANASVFNYYFDYSGNRNIMKYFSGYKNEGGACHADELFYLFDSRMLPFWINKRDQKVVNLLTRLWSNFAKYGNPTPQVTSEIPVRWLPSNKDELKFMYITDELRMGSMPNPEAYKLWDDLYKKHRKTDLKQPSILNS